MNDTATANRVELTAEMLVLREEARKIESNIKALVKRYGKDSLIVLEEVKSLNECIAEGAALGLPEYRGGVPILTLDAQGRLFSASPVSADRVAAAMAAAAAANKATR